MFKGFRPVVALGACMAALAGPACASPTAADWLARERVRCFAYLGVSQDTEMQVRRVAEAGFNCALAAPGLCDQPVERLKPLAEAAERNGLRIIWVGSMANQFSNPALREALAGDTRRFVGADGRKSPGSACPTDPVFWKAVWVTRALPLARLPGSAGLLLDTEDYAGGFDEDRYCHCDYCFGDFVKSIGREAGVAPADRHAWLVDNGLWAQYCTHQDEAATAVLRAARGAMDAVDADFLFASYPWHHPEGPEVGVKAPWDARLAGGLGTERAPFLILHEATYSWGYEPRVEAWSADLRAKGIHMLPVPGYNVVPAERVWWPEQVAHNAYVAAGRAGGYWIFLGNWAMLMTNDERPQQFGGQPDEWQAAFAHLNRVIEEGDFAHPPREYAGPIPFPAWLNDPRAYQLSDLLGPKHSPDATLRMRRWSEIGLPWDDGELVLTANKPGEWLSFEREIRRPDRYEISAWFTLGPDRGIVQLFSEGEPAGEPLDLYAPTTVPAQRLVAGRPALKAGTPRLELRVVGRNPESAGCAVGFTAVGVEPVGWWPLEWNVVLPFDNSGEGQPGWGAAYPPETETDLDATYEGKGVPVRWQTVATREDGYLDFIPLVSDIREEVAYALVYAYSPTEEPRSLRLGSDDGAKLWVNDEFVWGENLGRGAERDGDQPMAVLRAGWNKILIKVTQTRGEWGLYFRIYDADHALRYALQPE